jgi:hypothetical protein
MYASGCVAGDENDLANVIVAQIPLGAEYLLELTSGRVIEGTFSTYDAGYFCAASYQGHAQFHTNPACYRSPADSGADLIEASVVDSNGKVLTSIISSFVGTNTDIEKFKMKAQAPRRVTLTSDGPPCNGSRGDRTLLTIESP